MLPSRRGGAMSASKEVPPRGSYRFVLRTVRAWNPEIPRLASTYSESQQSRNIVHPDGRRAPTVFFSDADGVERLRKRGWEDVTAAWFKALDGAATAAPSAPATEPPRKAHKAARGTIEVVG